MVRKRRRYQQNTNRTPQYYINKVAELVVASNIGQVSKAQFNAESSRLNNVMYKIFGDEEGDMVHEEGLDEGYRRVRQKGIEIVTTAYIRAIDEYYPLNTLASELEEKGKFDHLTNYEFEAVVQQIQAYYSPKVGKELATYLAASVYNSIFYPERERRPGSVLGRRGLPEEFRYARERGSRQRRRLH